MQIEQFNEFTAAVQSRLAEHEESELVALNKAASILKIPDDEKTLYFWQYGQQKNTTQ